MVNRDPSRIVHESNSRYFGMKVGVFRGGCLTGPSHSGVELHGFLSYLVKIDVTGGKYSVFGYKGKQVRDNIHSYDVVRAIEEFAAAPRPGEVYNLGGGRGNSISMIEAIAKIEALTGRKIDWHDVDEAQGRSYLLHLESCETETALSKVGHHARNRPNAGRDDRVGATRSRRRRLTSCVRWHNTPAVPDHHILIYP
ncbi:MAG TPA: NAD-dependent epimerase/dehydratase family protein [Candidatus Acidoferrum sp.]